MNPLVSVIVASYNKEKYISETINSVLSQTYPNWELIIVDDLSTDQTGDIVKHFEKQNNRIHLYINLENKGANYSRNRGIRFAKGKYVIFLDADDMLSSNCLSTRVNHIENTNFDLCVFTMQIFKTSIGDLNGLWKPQSKKPLKDFLAHMLPWQTMQPIWDLNFLITIGGFDEKFQRLQDVELHTRALFQTGVKYKQVIGKPDCFYRIDEKRKNFNTTVFLERWIDAAIDYYIKFSPQAKQLKIDHYLMGTIYRTYLSMMYYYKTKEITKKEFTYLKSRLFNQHILAHFTLRIDLCFKLSSFFNLLPIRIPGVNFIINKILIM